MDFLSIAFLGFDLPGNRQKTKKAMGDLEAAHGLHFNSNVYDSTGHTSLSMFAQHHQLPLFILKISSTGVLS
jgi:hypothetical protein